MTPDTSEPDEQPSIEFRELQMIGRFRDLPEALLARTSLESAGIECFLADENVARMDWMWSNLFGGVKLYVKPEDASSAAAILEQPEPDHFEVEGLGVYDRPHCPKCNAIDIHFEELKPLSFISMYFGVPIPLHRKGWSCHGCGHRWSADENANA